MPVLVFYKQKDIPTEAAAEICEKIAEVTEKTMDAKVEIRVLEPVYMFNSNPIHIEMRFRDFGDWSDEKLASYHDKILDEVGMILKAKNIQGKYSFYILPSMPPRSMWAQREIN